eukprot:321099-Pyramimonas_sp.AAC.1
MVRKGRIPRDGASLGGFQNGRGVFAQFSAPEALTLDKDGNMIIADSNNHCIRRVTRQGLVSTVAGTGTAGHQDGDLHKAQFYFPSGVVLDAEDNIIVADYHNECLRKIDTRTNKVSTLAGVPGEAGHRNGVLETARFSGPRSLCLDKVRATFA